MPPLSLVDSHCHLNCLDLTPHDNRLEPVIADAAAVGVHHLLCVSVDLETFPEVQQIASEHANVYASVGVHPLYKDAAEPSVQQLFDLATDDNIVAIGETGLDYFYAKKKREWQQQRFIRHIQAAADSQLPLIVHTRGAKDDTLRLLADEGQGKVKGVLHCFTEDLDMAEQAMDMGFYVSISGIATFKNATNVRDMVKGIPLERLLVETDSPWLAPVPHRGKKNEPKYVREVAQCVADLKGVRLEELAEITSRNFFDLFSKAKPVQGESA